MSLRIQALVIEVTTDLGKYGTRHTFADGMNILRAENKAGKSTILRSILYALGLEGMMSPSHDVPLPHVVTSYVDLANGKAIVSEAHVSLEISNAEGQSLTTTREISGDRDKRIISVRDGAALTAPSSAGPASAFFVSGWGVRPRANWDSTRASHRSLAGNSHLLLVLRATR